MTAAVELMHEEFSLELIAVRRILERAATRLAAEKMNEATIAELEGLLDRLEGAPTEAERIPFDAEFHSLVARPSDNATLASMLAADPDRAAAALLHVATTESWFRRAQEDE